MNDPEQLHLAPGTDMPNSGLAVLIYRGVESSRFEVLFHDNDWHGVWRNGIYDYDHFHSTSHEVLGIEAGTGSVQLGGGGGIVLDVRPGDVLILPAGTGHRRLRASTNLSVIGGYPRGQEHPDLMRTFDDAALSRIANVALPTTDPVRGPGGPLLRLWQGFATA